MFNAIILVLIGACGIFNSILLYDYNFGLFLQFGLMSVGYLADGLFKVFYPSHRG